jgi:hypothetical protein
MVLGLTNKIMKEFLRSSRGYTREANMEVRALDYLIAKKLLHYMEGKYGWTQSREKEVHFILQTLKTITNEE